MTTRAEFEVTEGDSLPFLLTWHPSEQRPPGPIDVRAAVMDTEAWWRDWSSRCQSGGPWLDAVRRSLITLKALTYEQTGGIVAAPTTSLPEALGGVRNWDYRYCWLHDATLTLLALLEVGYLDEASAS
jgi:GH15 family glucan-1,4-alpha-glucosidase